MNEPLTTGEATPCMQHIHGHAALFAAYYTDSMGNQYAAKNVKLEALVEQNTLKLQNWLKHMEPRWSGIMAFA